MMYEVENYLSELDSKAQYKTIMFIGDRLREQWFLNIARAVQNLSGQFVVKYENNLLQMLEDLKRQKLELVVADPYYNYSKFTAYNVCRNSARRIGINVPPFVFMSSELTPQTAIDAIMKAKAQDVILYQEIKDLQLIARRIIFNGLMLPSIQ